MPLSTKDAKYFLILGDSCLKSLPRSSLLISSPIIQYGIQGSLQSGFHLSFLSPLGHSLPYIQPYTCQSILPCPFYLMPLFLLFPPSEMPSLPGESHSSFKSSTSLSKMGWFVIRAFLVASSCLHHRRLQVCLPELLSRYTRARAALLIWLCFPPVEHIGCLVVGAQ